MNLATRCPACGTVFRVVPDQLRVSQGWVRCGRCSEAFNAVEAMVEPPSAPLPTVPDGGTAAFTISQSMSAAATGSAFPGETQSSIETGPRDPDGAFESSDREAHTGEQPTPAELKVADETSWLLELAPGTALIASDGGVGTGLLHMTGGSERLGPSLEPLAQEEIAGVSLDSSTPAAVTPANDKPIASRASEPLRPLPAEAPSAPLPDDEGMAQRAPSFLVQAERAERWRRPGVRLALWLLALVAALALMAQAGFVFRDRLSATAPALRPLLQLACASLGCRVGDFRQIDALSVESSGLVRVEGSAVYRLSVTLRNRAAVEVAAPAIDLMLTDAQGRPIARRVLQMSDLYLPLRNLKPGSELPIQVPLGVGERMVSGYTVEIFYP